MSPAGDLPAPCPPAEPAPAAGRAGPRTWFLVDLDAFYVSVEQRRDPSLRGRCVAVGGAPGTRGVVCSASYEARRFGVTSAMPSSRAASLCPGLVFVPPDFPAYERASEEVFEVFRRFAPRVEPVSLDEAYLELTGCERVHARGGVRRPWLDVAGDLRAEVLGATSLSVSVGVGTTRTVAKVAASLAKPAGLLEVPAGTAAEFLAGLPVEALPGVGETTRAALARFGVARIGDLARLPDDLVAAALGRHGARLVAHARGREGDGDDDGPASRSLSRETSFARDVADPERLAAVLLELTQHATAALRAAGCLARSVGVKLRDATFRTREARRRFPEPTDADRDVVAAALDLLRRRHDGRTPLRLVGVALHGLVPAASRTPGLFDHLESSTADPPAARRLDAALDAVRARHGFDAVVRAGGLGADAGRPGPRRPRP